MNITNRYEWLIGLRYLRAKKSQHFISVITLLSMLGVALGVAALIVVLAVMTGFRAELQKQILGVTSHVMIQTYGGRMGGVEQILEIARQAPEVTGVAPFILRHAMILMGDQSAGVVIRGIDPALEGGVSDLQTNMTIGSLGNTEGFGIILGEKLAFNLGVRVGNKVTVVAPAGNVTPMGTLPRMKRFTVVGIFHSGMHDYDSGLAYIHLKDAQTFFRFGDNVTGVGIRTAHPDLAFEAARVLKEALPGIYSIQDWMTINRNFFRALQMEKATMFVILFLVVVVAAFNIISSLIMVVMEKGRDIAVLKTMGAGSWGVMSIFVINGGVIGLFGTSLGVSMGLGLAWNLTSVLDWVERTFHVQILSGEVYFIDHLPSQVVRSDVVLVAGISLLISLLAALYPAWRASRINPVETLRYE